MATAKRSRSALPGASRLNAFAMEPDALTIVGLDTQDGAEHPLYDERVKMKLDEGLVRNIMAYGVLEPALVRKNGHLVEVIDGRQRVRAAREANKRLVAEGYEPLRVPCMVRRDKDGDALGVMISANENRTDDGPLVRARKAQRLLNYGHSERQVELAFGISTPGLKNLLAILELDQKVQDMIASGEIPYSTAITLSDLPRSEQLEKAAEIIELGVPYVEAKRQERVRKARKKGKKVSTKQGNARGRHVKVKVLRRLAEDEKFMNELHPQARDVLRWVLGDETATERIEGLVSAQEE